MKTTTTNTRVLDLADVLDRHAADVAAAEDSCEGFNRGIAFAYEDAAARIRAAMDGAQSDAEMAREEGRIAGAQAALREVADRLDGEAHRLPVLADFAAKFRQAAEG